MEIKPVSLDNVKSSKGVVGKRDNASDSRPVSKGSCFMPKKVQRGYWPTKGERLWGKDNWSVEVYRSTDSLLEGNLKSEKNDEDVKTTLNSSKNKQNIVSKEDENFSDALNSDDELEQMLYNSMEKKDSIREV